MIVKTGNAHLQIITGITELMESWPMITMPLSQEEQDAWSVYGLQRQMKLKGE